MLCLTRPDVIAGMHDAFFDVGGDAVETATFGASPRCSPSTASPTAPTSSTSPPPGSPARSPPATPRRPRPLVAGSIGPGTKLPRLGHITFAELRDAYEVQAAGCSRAGSTSSSSRRAGPAAGQGRDDRLPPGDGRRRAARCRSSCRSRWRPPAGCSSAPRSAPPSSRSRRCAPDVFGINCATGPAEMHEHLRHLSQHSPLPIRVLPNAGLPRVVDGRTHYDLTPDQLADFHAPLSPSSASASSAAAAARRPTPPPGRRGGPRPLAGAVCAVVRAERVVDLQPGSVEQDPLPHHRRTHQR